MLGRKQRKRGDSEKTENKLKDRRGISEPSAGSAEKTKTPEWILKRYPDAPRELPGSVVEEFNAYLKEANELMDRYEKGLPDPEKLVDKVNFQRAGRYVETAKEQNRDAREVLEEAFIFTDFMNNFSYMIFGRRSIYSDDDMKEKFSNMRNAGGYEASRMIKNQTREEFYDIISKAIGECGLSYEKGKELFERNDNSANRYLFPVFLKLLEMGYKRYPDLIA